MEKLDVYFLSLSLLDFMMEGMALSGGRGSQEVVAHLIQLIEKMDPSLSKEKAEHCSERVFDAILNRDESFKDFSFEYFHFPSASFRRFSFRLVRFSQEDGGSYLYKPTEEGYLVYLGMLDLSPEIGAELMEKMLDLLVTRGKYREAIDIARRARTLSIEFRQLIGDSVGRAKRAPSSVKWSKTMTPKLDEARLHVEKRRREDERMIGSIDQSIEASKEASKKKELYVLREILDSSSLVRAKLLGEIVAAPEEFLAAQNFLFRPRGKIGLPDLEETLFPALLDLTLIELSESVDSIISALYKPQFPEVLDFNSLLYSVFAKKRQAAVPEFDDGEVLVVEPPPPKFSVEIIEHVQNWAAATLKRLGKLDISEFLELGGRS